jgi:WD40 repeat protein
VWGNFAKLLSLLSCSRTLNAEQRRQLYDATIVNAQEAVNRGEFESALSLLEKAEELSAPEARGFEFGHLQARVESAIATLKHRWWMSIYSVVRLPSAGRKGQIAFGTWDSLVRVFDLNTNQDVWSRSRHYIQAIKSEDATLPGHTDAVYSVAAFHNHNWIVSGSNDKTVKVWDVASGDLIHDLGPFRLGVRAVAISHDDRFLAIGCAAPAGPVDILVLQIQPDETSDDPRFREIVKFAIPTFQISQLDFSADGSFLAAGTEEDRPRVWRTSDWREVDGLPHLPGVVHAVAFSPTDVNQLAIGTGISSPRSDAGLVHLFDLENRQPIRNLGAHRGDVIGLSFSVDGARLLSGGKDGSIRVWDLNSGRLDRMIQAHSDAVT